MSRRTSREMCASARVCATSGGWRWASTSRPSTRFARSSTPRRGAGGRSCLTAIFTGLRASELRGLRWEDVDFARGELHVCQRADRYNQIGHPKSKAARRTVPVTPMLANTLREWKLRCPRGKLDLVFPTGAGNVIRHSDLLRRGLIPTLVRAGVVDAAGRAKYTGIHALRHFYASRCINRRADGGLELTPKVVQERLGHASIVMTLDTYSHLFPRGDDSGAEAAAEAALFARRIFLAIFGARHRTPFLRHFSRMPTKWA